MKTNSGKFSENQHSEIDWLGAIPKHWKVRRLKFISNVQSSSVDKKSKDDEDEVLLCNYVDVYKNEFIDDSIEFMKATAPQRHIEQFTLNQGDIIITKDSEDRFDIAVPAKVEKDFENVLCGYHLALIRPDSEQINSGFLFRWFQSDLVNDQFKVSANGITRYGLSVSSIKDSIVAVPPLPEQKSIASFLNHQATRIDQLIEKKKRLLDLLDEQRQAIITNTVTKGINPDTPMKDSGIDWLGDVPKHWDVEKLKYFVQLNNSEIEFNDEEEIVKVALENIESSTGKLIFEEDDKSFQGKGNPFANGDILFNKLRPYLAKVIHAEFNGVAVGELLVLTPDKSALNSKFLFYRLLSDQFIKIVNNSTYGAKMPRANWDFIGNLRIGIPPLNEQLEIGTYLDQRIKQFDQLKTKIQTAIDRLEEYRSSLITQAVTGKIDVRDSVHEVEMSYAAEEGELYKTNE